MKTKSKPKNKAFEKWFNKKLTHYKTILREQEIEPNDQEPEKIISEYLNFLKKTDFLCQQNPSIPYEYDVLRKAASLGSKVNIGFIDFILHPPIFFGWKSFLPKTKESIPPELSYIRKHLKFIEELLSDKNCPLHFLKSHQILLEHELARLNSASQNSTTQGMVQSAAFQRMVSKWIRNKGPTLKGGAPEKDAPNLIANVLMEHFLRTTKSKHYAVIGLLLLRIFPEITERLPKDFSKRRKYLTDMARDFCRKKPSFRKAHSQFLSFYINNFNKL